MSTLNQALVIAVVIIAALVIRELIVFIKNLLK